MNTQINELKHWKFQKETNTLIFDGQEMEVKPHTSQLYDLVDELYTRDGVEAIPAVRELGEIYDHVERISPPPADPVLEREYWDTPNIVNIWDFLGQ